MVTGCPLEAPSSRRRTITPLTVALMLAAVFGPDVATAQGWPDRPVRILLPVGPGGVSDINARVLAQRWSGTLGQSVLIDNRPGAGGVVATEMAKNALPDGHTLLWLNSGHAVATAVMKSLPYDAVADFAPVSTIGFFAQAVLVGADSPVKSVQALVSAGRANPRKVILGVTNVGSTQHLTAELFKAMGQFTAEVVPYKTSGPLLGAARTGEASAVVDFIAPALPLVQAGTLRALAVTSRERFPGLPGVPTVAEAGLPGFEATAWNGLAGPAKTPRAIIDRLHREVHASIALPEVIERLREIGIELRGSTPEGMRQLMAAEIAKWRRVVEQAKIERQ